MPTTEAENMELVQRFEDTVWNERNLDAIDVYLDEDFVQHEETGHDANSPDEWRENVAEPMLSAFPDLALTTEDVIAEGDTVVTRVVISGTHEGEFMGLPATGNAFKVEGIHIARFEDRQIVERWIQADVMGMMEQLGVQ